MPATIHISGNGASSNFQEWTGANGTGTNVNPIGPVGYVSSDPTIATVDPATGAVGAVAVGAATITAKDAGNRLAASGTPTGSDAGADFSSLAVTADPRSMILDN